jgi:hypothetical protein
MTHHGRPRPQVPMGRHAARPARRRPMSCPKGSLLAWPIRTHLKDPKDPLSLYIWAHKWGFDYMIFNIDFNFLYLDRYLMQSYIMTQKVDLV